MLKIYQITVPTPYPVGPVNSYLIDSPPYTLVDPGPDTKEAREALYFGIRECGVEVEAIERVLVTHSHLDHSGLAPEIWRRFGADIYMHPYEYDKLTPGYNFVGERIPFIMQMGVPLEALMELTGERDKVPKPAFGGTKYVPVSGGEQLEFKDGEMEILNMPGHATGHLCLYDSEGGNLISGDFLLPGITPNPMLEQDPENPGQRAKSLTDYLKGLDFLGSKKINRVWPGHGVVVESAQHLIDSARAHHEKRLAQISDILASGGGLSTYLLSKVFYPDLKGFQIFLGLSEVQAHLDVLVERGKARVELQGDTAIYY